MTIPWDLDISHNSHIPLGLLHSSKNTDYHSEFLSCCELWFLFTEACFRLTVIRNWDTELGYETTAMSFHPLTLSWYRTGSLLLSTRQRSSHHDDFSKQCMFTSSTADGSNSFEFCEVKRFKL